MAKKRRRNNCQPGFIAVQFEDDTESVMVPVSDSSVIEDEEKKQTLIQQAWVFRERGRYVREATNPKFIKAIADDLLRTLPLPRMAAQLAVAHVGQIYIERFEREALERGAAIADKHALHLTAETDEAGNLAITIDVPNGWEEKAIARFEEVLSNLFEKDGACSWVGFAEWLWINLTTRALENLEGEFGPEVLQGMSECDFEAALLGRIFESQDGTEQFVELILRHLDFIVDVFVSASEPEKQDLWVLELLLGFRERPPEGIRYPWPEEQRVIVSDFRALLQAISKRPEELYRLAPRRFEELIAEIFTQFGYEVRLTPETRDGGFDVSAIRRAEVDLRILIECKRYTPPRKVSRPVVQQLYGVLRHENATKGIIATTATFSTDAKAFCAEHPWRLEARDRDNILRWIKMLDRPRSGLWTPGE
jgi:hypothetical protein